MNNKRKIVLYTGGAAGLLIIIIFVVILINSKVSREIPKISDSGLLADPVKEQISKAFLKARFNPSANNLGKLGMVYHSSSNYNEAAKCYQLAAQRSEKDWIWYYYNGYLNMEMGNSDAVIENFKKVSVKNPNVQLAWYYLGEEYKNLRKYEMAEKSFERITGNKYRSSSANEKTRQDHFPLKTYANFELARIYFDQGQNDLAEKTLKEILKKDKLFGPSYKLLGTIYNLKGDTTLGKQYTIRANDLIIFSPPVDTLLDKLAIMSRSELYLLKKIDEAEFSFHSDWALKLVNQGLKYIPDNSYLISKAINIYLWKNLNENAIALTEKHLALISENYTELKNTGIVFYHKGLYAEAMKYWTRALEIKSDEIIVQEYQAKCLWATGNKQQTLDLLDDIIEKNPDNTEVFADVTELLFQFGQKEKANDFLKELQKIDPENPKAKRLSGEIALANKDIKKAIALNEEAFKGNPEDVKTIGTLGEIYKHQQMWKKYIILYNKALEYSPNSPDFLGRLGEVFISCPDTSLRNIEKGKEYAERAFTYYNCPPDILIAAGSHLAYAYAMLGDKQNAVTTISQTINIGRREKITPKQQENLETLLNAFQNMEDQ